MAQTAGAPSNQGLEEIIVTAQKREENMQSVPVAVSALNASTLEAARITSVNGLGAIVPNFQVIKQPSNAALPAYSLRGVLGGETASQVDNGVSIYIDGVYLGRSAGTMFDIADIERVEVLRGPQGTLFGRNTTGGAVNFITRDPSGEFALRQDLTYGSYDEFRSRTRIDFPEFAGFKTSLTYAHHQADGYVKNLAAGVTRIYGPSSNGRIGTSVAAKTLGEDSTDSLFFNALYDNGGPLTASYKFDYTDFAGSQLGIQALGFRGSNDIPGSNGVGPTAQFVYSLQPGLGGTNIITDKPLKSIYDPQRGTDTLEVMGHNLSLNWQVSDSISIKNIAAYRESDQTSYGNSFDGNKLIDPFGGTGNDFSFLNAFSSRKQHQFSDELQITGTTEKLEWVAGAFYFKERARDYNPVQFFMTFPAQGQPVPITPAHNFANARITNTSYALFGQATYHLTDKWSLTGGLRQTWDKRKETNFLATPTATGTADFDKLTWQASAQYQATPEIMTYAKIGTGYLSGGIYNGKSFQPEGLTAYEIGLKSEFFDNRVRLNLAGFISDYKDLQVSVFTTVLNYENAGKANIKGVEGELTLAPIDGLTIGANFGLLDFEYDEYISLVTGAPTDIADFAQRPNTPKRTFSTNVQYDMPQMSNGAYISLGMDANYASDMQFITLPLADPVLAKQAKSPAHWIVNGRVSLVDLPIASSKVKLSGWAQNIFDERVPQFVADISGLVAASYNKPRTVGIDLSFQY